MSALLAGGIVFTLMGILAILVEEGVIGLFHPMDFWGGESSEPIKRAGAHISLVAGMVMLVMWLVGTAVGALT